jgi:Calcineurin-like phosphoesterase
LSPRNQSIFAPLWDTLVRTSRSSRYHLLAALTLLPAGACTPEAPASFQHDLSSAETPWTHDRFDDSEAQFTFGIFSDLNGGERSGVFAVAAQQLALLRPELVLSVGDLIDAATDDATALSGEWDAFDAVAGQIPAPVFRVGGNHDLTGQQLRDLWAERYGPRYYHFVYKDVLFLILDTEDNTDARVQEIYEARTAAVAAIDAGVEGARDMEYFHMPERVTGNIGVEQSEYVQTVLAANPDVRWTMLFMHKPVWLDDSDPEFVAIEAAMAARPYTVFNGHRHSMSHRVKNGRDYIMLGTTGGGQNANDEMSFDHVTLVTVGADSPSIAHLRLDGILDKTGAVPTEGAELCFQASACE